MKLEKIINSGIPVFSGALLLLVILFTFAQIIFRQFFKISFNWSDEVSQFCVSWMTLLGSIWVSKHEKHINTGFKLHKKLNERQIHLIDGILELIIAGIAAVVAYQSAIFALSAMDTESLSLSWLKMGYIFIALPIAMLAVCYYYLKSFFKNLARIFRQDN
jgi:TRAP-type C4-dicarboxylate transport system permease small subunit